MIRAGDGGELSWDELRDTMVEIAEANVHVRLRVDVAQRLTVAKVRDLVLRLGKEAESGNADAEAALIELCIYAISRKQEKTQ
jgi:hypothetical protein